MRKLIEIIGVPAILLAAVGPVAGQGAGACAGGMPAFGSLGIGKYRCVGGSCSVNMRTGDPYAHSFSTEPRLLDIDPAGPGADLLREGDVLVAIDGVLITTAEGGRRLGSIQPGQDVHLTLRRQGRELDAWLEAEASCDLPRLEVSWVSGFGEGFGTYASKGDSAWAYAFGDSAYRLADPVWNYALVAPDSSWTTFSDSIAGVPPFLLHADSIGLYPDSIGFYADSVATAYTIGRNHFGVLGASGELADAGFPPGFLPSVRRASRPRVEFGVELSCGGCGWRGHADALSFRTEEFPLIESVEKDGPADRAGLLPGDVLISVEGLPITSREAGRALGALTAGDAVRLEVRRGDRIVGISITPREADGRGQRM